MGCICAKEKKTGSFSDDTFSDDTGVVLVCTVASAYHLGERYDRNDGVRKAWLLFVKRQAMSVTPHVRGSTQSYFSYLEDEFGGSIELFDASTGCCGRTLWSPKGWHKEHAHPSVVFIVVPGPVLCSEGGAMLAYYLACCINDAAACSADIKVLLLLVDVEHDTQAEMCTLLLGNHGISHECYALWSHNVVTSKLRAAPTTESESADE